MNPGWISAPLTALGIIVTLALAWHGYVVKRKSAVAALVREAEGRRVLWAAYGLEDHRGTYESIQAIRGKIREARASLPPNAKGIASLDEMQEAAEFFCAKYEPLEAIGEFEDPDMYVLLFLFRRRFVPALDRLQKQYRLGKGYRHRQRYGDGLARHYKIRASPLHPGIPGEDFPIPPYFRDAADTSVQDHLRRDWD